MSNDRAALERFQQALKKWHSRPVETPWRQCHWPPCHESRNLRRSHRALWCPKHLPKAGDTDEQ